MLPRDHVRHRLPCWWSALWIHALCCASDSNEIWSGLSGWRAPIITGNVCWQHHASACHKHSRRLDLKNASNALANKHTHCLFSFSFYSELARVQLAAFHYWNKQNKVFLKLINNCFIHVHSYLWFGTQGKCELSLTWVVELKEGSWSSYSSEQVLLMFCTPPESFPSIKCIGFMLEGDSKQWLN